MRSVLDTAFIVSVIITRNGISGLVMGKFDPLIFWLPNYKPQIMAPSPSLLGRPLATVDVQYEGFNIKRPKAYLYENRVKTSNVYMYINIIILWAFRQMYWLCAYMRSRAWIWKPNRLSPQCSTVIFAVTYLIF